MSNIDFPNSPAKNDTFISFDRIFKFLDSGWELVITEPPDSGVIDCNVDSGHDIIFQGGISVSNFAGLKSIDCGEG